MSITRSPLLVLRTWIPPPGPPGTTAALSTTPPSNAFRTTVPGHAILSCQAAIHATACPAGVIETKFIEYAAPAGIPQLDWGIGMIRAWPATSEGGPNAPVRFEPPWARVSRIRQGVIEMKTSPVVLPLPTSFCSAGVCALTLGIGQFFTAIVFGWTCCAKPARINTITPISTGFNGSEPDLENLERGQRFISADSSSLGPWYSKNGSER
jgi:hypothetical protein